MYISAAEFGLICDCMAYAVEMVEQSNGEIYVFSGHAVEDYDAQVDFAAIAKELLQRFLDNDEIMGYDHVLLKETFNTETNAYMSCLDLINELFYDDYGKLRKASYAPPTIEKWIQATERTHTVSLSMFPRTEIERALDFLGDLWLDNELSGWHNPDGTFNVNRGKEAE